MSAIPSSFASLTSRLPDGKPDHGKPDRGKPVASELSPILSPQIQPQYRPRLAPQIKLHPPAPRLSAFFALSREPEDARITGGTRSLDRRLLALNLYRSAPDALPAQS